MRQAVDLRTARRVYPAEILHLGARRFGQYLREGAAFVFNGSCYLLVARSDGAVAVYMVLVSESESEGN